MRSIKELRNILGLSIACLLILATVFLYAQGQTNSPEIALVIGEPYEDMRKRSSAKIDPALPNEIWYSMPKSDARLRFIDTQYGFVTPLARFFTVSYKQDLVSSVRLSPQIEPLLLDDALKVILDLQNQWRQRGWMPIKIQDWPPFADTQEVRAALRNENKGWKCYWQAGNKFQILFLANRFQDDKHPNEERYLITLQISTPWIEENLGF